MSSRNLLKQFCDVHNFAFKNIDLLETALTHSSFVNEHRSEKYRDNERLEFLGDAVLELAISQFLFNNYGDLNEGEMTKLRAQHVCEPALVTYANNIELGDYLRLGKGEELSGGRNRPALLADAFEAVLGAIYLDFNLGFDRVYQFLEDHVFPLVKDGNQINVIDYKSKLQELVQTDNTRTVRYEIVSETGPAHNKTFISEVFMDEIKMGVGEGHSKKEAEQNAAKVALDKMVNEYQSENI
ncbi:MAG: rnc [Haloplasmataceae bacterium]|jgi:ribonuclease-3|nr:rnc [Haloplasmataceae bacterium]